MSVKLYRPSNGVEGLDFQEKFCVKCSEDDFYNDPNKNCDILCRTLNYSISEEEYPKEWRYVNGKPVCTKFKKEKNNENNK